MYAMLIIATNMKRQKTPIQVDVRGFIASFGGAAEMRATWIKNGFALTKGAQDKWVMRGVIPTSRVLEATQVARLTRSSFDLNDFLLTKKRGVK
jgi:hypothetical protein